MTSDLCTTNSVSSTSWARVLTKLPVESLFHSPGNFCGIRQALCKAFLLQFAGSFFQRSCQVGHHLFPQSLHVATLVTSRLTIITSMLKCPWRVDTVQDKISPQLLEHAVGMYNVFRCTRPAWLVCKGQMMHSFLLVLGACITHIMSIQMLVSVWLRMQGTAWCIAPQ